MSLILFVNIILNVQLFSVSSAFIYINALIYALIHLFQESKYSVRGELPL